MKNYIPAELWKDTYKSASLEKSFTFAEKVPLSKIKIDKSLFSFQNNVNPSFVDFIVENFDRDFWMPILVNADFFLLDGQHRLQVAKKLGLKYIDVAIVKARI
jgi:hypothetical protein